MGDVPVSNGDGKGAAVPDGRDLSMQQLLDLWLSFPPRVRRDVLRGLYNHEQSLRRMSTTAERPGAREWSARTIEPVRAARWLLRGISKAMDPTYDQRADGTPNADPYKVHGGTVKP